MIIGIDGNEANIKNRVGISEYSYELLRQFKEFTISNLQYQIYLKNNPLGHMPVESDNLKYKIIGPKRFWTQFSLPLHLLIDNPKPDIFFSPTHYAPRFSTIPTAISIMDISYLRFPELFAKRDLYKLINWTRYSIRNAKLIFTISQSSKNDIMKYYHAADQKIIITYPGIKPKIDNGKIITMEEVLSKYGVSEKFVLFVGTIQPRKNIARLIEAFSFIIKNHPDIELVIIGKKGWLYESIFSKPKELKIEKKIKFLDYVPDGDLEVFYKYAVCYCLPSLYEGFGLPVLEAMKHGCPVITSNVSSLPEAGGDAALYVDPMDAMDIANKLEQLITDKSLRTEYIKKGYKQVKKFTWKKTARQTLKVLQEVVREK